MFLDMCLMERCGDIHLAESISLIASGASNTALLKDAMHLLLKERTYKNMLERKEEKRRMTSSSGRKRSHSETHLYPSKDKKHAAVSKRSKTAVIMTLQMRS